MKRPTIPQQRAKAGFPGRLGAEFIVDYLFYALGKSDVTYSQIAEKAGISEETLKKWRSKKIVPRLDKIEACFEVLGYELIPRHTGVNPDPKDPDFPISWEWWRVHQERRGIED